jgi:hypothetical protein
VGGLGRPSQPLIATTDLRTRMAQLGVLRGGVEPPTFRFSGLGITMQEWPWTSPCLLSDLRCTHMDAGVRACMRLEMRLLRSIRAR